MQQCNISLIQPAFLWRHESVYWIRYTDNRFYFYYPTNVIIHLKISFMFYAFSWATKSVKESLTKENKVIKSITVTTPEYKFCMHFVRLLKCILVLVLHQAFYFYCGLTKVWTLSHLKLPCANHMCCSKCTKQLATRRILQTGPKRPRSLS